MAVSRRMLHLHMQNKAAHSDAQRRKGFAVSWSEQKRLLPYTHLAGSSVQLCHKVEMLLLARRQKKKNGIYKNPGVGSTVPGKGS